MLRFICIAVLLGLMILGFVTTASRFEWIARPSFANEIVGFLLISTIVLYRVVVRGLGLRPQDFVRIYLGTTVLRILFFGAFIFVVIRFDKVGAWRNATLFLVSYFLFTTLEILALFFRVNSPRKGGQKDI